MTFRASALLVARLEELAKARGCTRSAAIKAAIVEATLPDGAPAVPDEHEVLCLLGEAARAGSVPAMRALWAYHRGRTVKPDAAGALAGVDELAALRESRSG